MFICVDGVLGMLLNKADSALSLAFLKLGWVGEFRRDLSVVKTTKFSPGLRFEGLSSRVKPRLKRVKTPLSRACPRCKRATLMIFS
jgi:hypothetical protein